MDLISVIIPVYNVEKYLDICVKSILVQSYRNIEIILVDDGSTDSSGRMCDAYAAADDRIVVLHQANRGLSGARNSGINICKGDYITFLDSDDFVSSYFLEILYKCIQKYGADICELAHHVIFVDGVNEQSVPLAKGADDYSARQISSDKAIEQMLYQQIPASASSRLCKRSVFDTVRFPEGYLFEDLACAHRVFMQAENIVIVDANLTAYRMRADSIVHRKFNKTKMTVIPVTQELFQDLKEQKPALTKAAGARAFVQIFSVYIQIPLEETAAREELWDEIKKYRRYALFNADRDFKLKNRLAAIGTLLGARAAWCLGRESRKMLRADGALWN